MLLLCNKVFTAKYGLESSGGAFPKIHKDLERFCCTVKGSINHGQKYFLLGCSVLSGFLCPSGTSGNSSWQRARFFCGFIYFFFLLVQVSCFGFGVEQRGCKFLVALLLLPKQEAKKKIAENPNGLIRKGPKEEFCWPEDFKIPLSFCLSVHMCVAWVRESIWGDTCLEKVVLWVWLFTQFYSFYLVTACWPWGEK